MRGLIGFTWMRVLESCESPDPKIPETGGDRSTPTFNGNIHLNICTIFSRPATRASTSARVL
jgi:hypothetical protein